MAGSTFDELWTALSAQIEAHDERLVRELGACWLALDSTSQGLAESFQSVELPEGDVGRLESIRQLLDETARTLFEDPLTQFESTRPLRRLIRAIEHHQAAVEETVRQLPATVTASPAEIGRAVAAGGHRTWRTSWRRLWRKPRPFPLRETVRHFMRRHAARRAKLDGRFVLLVAQGTLALLDPWQATRGALLRQFDEVEPDPRALGSVRGRWGRRLGADRQRAARLQGQLERRTRSTTRNLAVALARGRRAGGRRAQRADSPRLVRYTGYWSRLLRSVGGQVGLERAMVDLGRGASRVMAEALESLEQEHRDVEAELQLVVETLEGWQRGDHELLPPASARLASAADRTRAWALALSDLARKTLPGTLDVINPKRALPGWLSPWKTLQPLTLFRDAVKRLRETEGDALSGFQEVEAAHQAIVRDIERAREVVTFGIDAGAEAHDASMELAREGATNILPQLQQHRARALDVRQLAERNLVFSVAAIFYELHIATEQGRLGLLSHLAREGGYQFRRVAVRLVRHYWRRLGRFQEEQRAWLTRWGLRWIGWLPPPETTTEHVQRRASFGETPGLDFAPTDLPMIYRRLFRLEPVEDPRFLVGREVEIAAFAEARERWESGRAVSVVLVGARGSGKTSLLNCALVRVFDDLAVVRGTFDERIQSADQMNTFVRGLLGIEDGDELLTALGARRRVVILEEVERTFLRRIGGTAGLAELLARIGATSQTTLWILSLNLHAFRFLDGAVGLSGHFSHRINAMAVEPENLKAAVLQRHHLSGLRLQFARAARGSVFRTAARR